MTASPGQAVRVKRWPPEPVIITQGIAMFIGYFTGALPEYSDPVPAR